MSVDANTTVLGLSFNQDSLAASSAEYFAVNTFVSAVVPVPLAGPLVAIGALVFGLVGGMTLNVLSSTLGSYGTLLLTRSFCRPCFLRMLGRQAGRWQNLDAAIIADGPMLALLIRCTPLFPLVVTNVLLSLTSISHFNYCWTTLLGLIPANLPYAYAAKLGLSLYEHFPPKDPLMLALTVFGLVASVGIAYKVGRIAKSALQRHGLERGQPTDEPDFGAAPAAAGRGAGVGPSAQRVGAEERAVDAGVGMRTLEASSNVALLLQPPLKPRAGGAGSKEGYCGAKHLGRVTRDYVVLEDEALEAAERTSRRPSTPQHTRDAEMTPSQSSGSLPETARLYSAAPASGSSATLRGAEQHCVAAPSAVGAATLAASPPQQQQQQLQDQQQQLQDQQQQRQAPPLQAQPLQQAPQPQAHLQAQQPQSPQQPQPQPQQQSEQQSRTP